MTVCGSCREFPDIAQLSSIGDVMQKLGAGYYRAMGRSDDTMNLGGIKVGNAEIERVVLMASLPPPLVVEDVAAVATPTPGGGPTRLWIVVVLKKYHEHNESSPASPEALLRRGFQAALSQKLNPLFKVFGVLVVATLPRTASNKVMRRVLRTMCEKAQIIITPRM